MAIPFHFLLQYGIPFQQGGFPAEDMRFPALLLPAGLIQLGFLLPFPGSFLKVLRL